MYAFVYISLRVSGFLCVVMLVFVYLGAARRGIKKGPSPTAGQPVNQSASQRASRISLWATAEATFKQPGQYPGTREWQITVTVSSPLRHAPAMIHKLNQWAGSGLVATITPHGASTAHPSRFMSLAKQHFCAGLSNILARRDDMSNRVEFRLNEESYKHHSHAVERGC